MEAQQLASKVAQLETRVATLEDEGKIIKGEVKQILTEIRSAILVRDNPFDGAADFRAPAPPVEAHVAAPQVVVVHEPAPAAPQPEAPHATAAHSAPEPPAKEPIMLRPQQAQAVTTPAPLPVKEAPQWSLLTIAGLSAWAEDAMRRLGALRVEILLDLCEAAGHLTPEARQALSRITELDLPEPAAQPSNNETVVILRQLEALVHDADGVDGRLQLRA